MTWPAGTTMFTEARFFDTQQLLAEFRWVPQVRAYLGSVTSVLTSGTGEPIDVQSIARQAEALLAASPEANLSADYADVVDAALEAAPPITPGSSSAMSVLATAATVTRDLANLPSGLRRGPSRAPASSWARG